MIPALLWLIARLARKHDVRVFALRQERQAGEWPLLGATVENVGQPWPVVRATLAIRRQHARKPFDLVHCVWGGDCALAGVAAARWLGIPALVHLAGGELAALRDIRYGGRLRWHRRVLDQWSLRRAAQVTAASGPIIDLARPLGIEVARVPLGVDVAEWPPVPPRRRKTGERARLIHVASLNRVKDQPTLLRALQRLAHTGADFHLDIVGTDTLDGAVQRLAAALGLADRVTFHGFRTQRELRPLMKRAHLHLLSSRHEAGPLVLLEAAIAGVPTVGTAVGHVSEWADGAAICVPVGDDAALALGAHRLLGNDAERMCLAAEAQRRAMAMDADFTMRCFDRIYFRLINELGSRAAGH